MRDLGKDVSGITGLRVSLCDARRPRRRLVQGRIAEREAGKVPDATLHTCAVGMKEEGRGRGGCVGGDSGGDT